MRFATPQLTTTMMALIIGTLWILLRATRAQQNLPAPVPQSDTCTVDVDGTAHITRVIPALETSGSPAIPAHPLRH